MFKRLATLSLWVACTALQAAPWAPPAQPDVDQILKQTRELSRPGGDPEQAAAMHRWYHQHALAYAPSHSGVRLSFALSDWHALALRYPPALADMQAARDRAAERLRAGGPNPREAMSDLAALDQQLADPRVSAELMAWLDANRPADARSFAPLALAAVVASGQHALALRYLDQDALVRNSERQLRGMTESAGRLPEAQRPEFRQGVVSYLDRQAAPAVAALAQAGRAQDAQQLLDRLQGALGQEAQLHLCRDGLRGFAPPFRRY